MQEKEEQKAEQIETNVENVPKWYLTPPDGKGVVILLVKASHHLFKLQKILLFRKLKRIWQAQLIHG